MPLAELREVDFVVAVSLLAVLHEINSKGWIILEGVSLGDHHFSLHLHGHLVYRVDALDLLDDLGLLGGDELLGVVVDL